MRVEPFTTDRLARPCDILISALGYEARARSLLEDFPVSAKTKLAIRFTTRQVLDFKKNVEIFEENAFEFIEDTNPNQLANRLECVFREAKSAKLKQLRVRIDISCLTRTLIAFIVSTVNRAAIASSIATVCEFVYVVASFSPPGLAGPILTKGPVVPELSGWNDPSRPCAMICGIGYEKDLALGVLEDIEPAALWVFEPTSRDLRYRSAIHKANKTIFSIAQPNERLTYPVESPFDLYVSLEALTFRCLKEYRPILIPFGPKIFALASILVALSYFPNVAVWRVSSGHFGPPTNRFPSGLVVGLVVTLPSGKHPLMF